MLIAFNDVFPDVASDETRVVHRAVGDGEEAFGLIEFYCPDPECACRRVVIRVIRFRDEKTMATVGFSLDTLDERDDLNEWGIEDRTQLEPMSEQSDRAEEFLEIVKTVALSSTYRKRLERHYGMMKQADVSAEDDVTANSNWTVDQRDNTVQKSDSGYDEAVYLDAETVERFRKERMKRRRRLMRSSTRRKIKQAKKLARFPMERAAINDTWRSDRWASIVVVRRKPKGRRAVLAMLVDLGCLGLKTAMLRTDVSMDEAAQLQDKIIEGRDNEKVPGGLAARILQHGVAWKQKAGLEVNPMVFVAEAFLGQWDKSDSDVPIPLGRYGQFFYVPGPDDEWEPVINTLREEHGEEGFNFMLPSDQYE